MKTGSLQILWAVALGAGMGMSGCKSTPPAPAAGTTATGTTATTASSSTNPDGSITNADGSVTYPSGSSQARTAQGTRNADGSITNPDGSVTYPAGTSKAQSTNTTAPSNTAASATPAPAVAAPAPAPVERLKKLPNGTEVIVSLGETLSASKNNVGDRFSGVLAEAVRAPGGGTVFARGTRVEGTVAAAKGRGRFKGAGDLAIELTSIAGMRVSTTEYEKTQAGKGKRTAGMIGGGGGLGAIIGGLAGGGKGAIIGGLAGAGAGTAASAYTGNKDVVIPAETAVTFRLTAPLTVR